MTLSTDSHKYKTEQEPSIRIPTTPSATSRQKLFETQESRAIPMMFSIVLQRTKLKLSVMTITQTS